MKEIIAYTLMCSNPTCHCELPLQGPSGMMPVFQSETQAQLAIEHDGNTQPGHMIPRIQKIRITEA